MNLLYLISGLVIFILTLADFFYTTLSGSGSGLITSTSNNTLGKFLNPGPTKTIRKWTGLLHITITLAEWIILIWLSGFLVLLGMDELVIDAQTQKPADWVERLYFSGYVFSTLGNGGLAPGNSFARIFTVIFSITGFAMLTTAITYLLSVTNAALEKKNLASFISDMGTTPLSLYRFFTATESPKLFLERVDELVDKLNSHTNNHLSYPIVHYFLASGKARSVAINIASLYEALIALRIKFDSNPELKAQSGRLFKAISNYLEVAVKHRHHNVNSGEIYKAREEWNEINIELSSKTKEGITANLDSAIFNLLKSQGWKWDQVYHQKSQ